MLIDCKFSFQLFARNIKIELRSTTLLFNLMARMNRRDEEEFLFNLLGIIFLGKHFYVLKKFTWSLRLSEHKKWILYPLKYINEYRAELFFMMFKVPTRGELCWGSSKLRLLNLKLRFWWKRWIKPQCEKLSIIKFESKVSTNEQDKGTSTNVQKVME